MAKPPCALVLAAGQGRRMGRDKALLKLGGRTLVEEHVDALRRAGCDDIAIARRQDAAPLPSGLGAVTVVIQPERDAPMFDSLVLGLFALSAAPVLVIPVDNDLVGDDTLEMLVAEANDASATHAVVPRFGDRNGHPVVLFQPGIDAVVLDAANPEGEHRLDRLLSSWGRGVRPFDTGDEAVCRDFDTPADLARSR